MNVSGEEMYYISILRGTAEKRWRRSTTALCVHFVDLFVVWRPAGRGTWVVHVPCVCVYSRRRARRWSICLQLWAPVCVAFTRAHSVDNGRHGCQVELTCTLANMPVWRHESAVYDVSPPGPMQRRIIHSHPATHATAPPCAEQCSAVRPLFDLQSLSSSSPPAPPVRCYTAPWTSLCRAKEAAAAAAAAAAVGRNTHGIRYSRVNVTSHDSPRRVTALTLPSSLLSSDISDRPPRLSSYCIYVASIVVGL